MNGNTFYIFFQIVHHVIRKTAIAPSKFHIVGTVTLHASAKKGTRGRNAMVGIFYESDKQQNISPHGI